MKTAISIPDSVFAAAEATSRRLGMSRSEFYAKAVQAFVEVHLATGVTERLNEVYADESSVLDPALARMQFASLPRESW